MAQNWNAWGESWGLSWDGYWGTLDVLPPDTPDHRPRTNPNVRFTPVRSARVTLLGSSARAETGSVRAVGAVVAARPPVRVRYVEYANVRVTGAGALASVGRVRARGAATTRIYGVRAKAATVGVSARGAAKVALCGAACCSIHGGASANGGARARISVFEEVVASVPRISGRGVHNPTDEELALLAIRLTMR